MKSEIRISPDSRKAVIGGVEYTWEGGFGAVMSSDERGLSRGDTRIIGNLLFYVFSIWPSRPWPLRSRVCWGITDPTIEQIRAIREAIFT